MGYVDISNPKITSVTFVDLHGSEKSLLGTLHVTSSHLIFKADGVKEIWNVIGLISSTERIGLVPGGCKMVIKFKHFQTVTLIIPTEKDCIELCKTLNSCMRINDISECFAFGRRRDHSKNPNDFYRLNWAEEFKRQNVSDAWRSTDFNSKYEYCDTYPSMLWVPSSSSVPMLIASAKFRSRGRLPALTYFYEKSGATLCRCSQPLTGFSGRCTDDESLMNFILAANPTNQNLLYLIDTRPKVNAIVNKVQGKGYEDVRYYQNTVFKFFDIENIHVMRNSQNKLLEACTKYASINDYLKAVDSSGWLKHLRGILECSKFIADAMRQGVSCVVHCSDGWDRTAQTVSVAQILLDPYYRTIRGFEVLIEKDWLGFGHKFDDRCGHVYSATEDVSKEVSPIFTQFLDVVHQLMVQKPTDFEFNDRFLAELNEHAYSCVYGTLIGNNEKQRTELRVAHRTDSLWDYFEANVDDYKNPFFIPHRKELQNVSLQSFAFNVWSELYNRFDVKILPKETLSENIAMKLEHIKLLEKTIESLNQNEKLKYKLNPAWKPLLNNDVCASKGCKREFNSFYDVKNHCYACGEIFCARCIKDEKLCDYCSRNMLAN